MTFVWLPEEGASANDELARFHEEFLAAGAIEWTGARAEDFRAILTAAWLQPIPWMQGGTTCALWQGTAMQAAGIQARRKVNPRYAITTWLKVNGFAEDNPETEYLEGSWIPASKLEAAGGVIRGDLPYFCGGNAVTWQAATNGHVVCVTRGIGYDWVLAQGGAANGRCKLGDAPVSILFHSNRPLRGVWRPNLMTSVIRGRERDTIPAPAPKATPYPGTPLTLRRGSKGEAVKRVQRIVGATVDGDYGPRTEGLVRSFQIAHDLQADGVVGPMTWTALLAAEAA